MGKAPLTFASVVLGIVLKSRSHMDLHRMIAELQAERQRLDEAIQALERLSAGNARRRGRPPAWLKDEIQRQVPTSEKTDSESLAKTKKA